MENFHLYTGNDLELLADRMVETLAVPPKNIFTPERFIVQSKGMEFWLSQHIARARGICANVIFEYPESFLQSLYRTMHADVPRESGWERGTLAWIIMRLLPGLLTNDAFAIVRSYLAARGSDRIDRQKLYQLAVRIADLFDQYMVFRADRVLEWERTAVEADTDAEWQRLLWRAIVQDERGGPLHRARMQQRLMKKFLTQTKPVPELPERITVFGISYLPQYYIDVLTALPAHVEVNYFAINPSAAYWSDVTTPRETRTMGGSIARAFVGNSLLSSLGVQGRDFYEMLLERGLTSDDSAFAEPPRDTLLHRIQNDLYTYCETASAEAGATEEPLPDGDDSIVLQNCHSPMREMEVLHDHLLSMFERSPEVEPGDIIVMAPAIEVYAPYIEAVFDTVERNRIPYTIADRSVKSEHRIAEAFMMLLRFHRTRFAASSVLELLECENIAGRFGLTLNELDAVKLWIRDCRIRWGLDNASIAKQYNLPIDNVNTWRYGLDRMLLGYAYPSQGNARMFEGIPPFDNIEGSGAETFGKLLAFFTRLEAIDALLPGTRTLAEWGIVLLKAADDFFLMSYEEKSAVMPVLGELALIQERSGYTAPVDIAVVIDVLNGAFDSEGASQRFLRGGVSFCSLLPMRSIPAKIICLIGMNTGAFPRQQQKLGFNEMTKHPRKGDRSRRNDDRYMFLEALLSARQQLYISWCGQSRRDNASLPPSVAVSELLDYMENNFFAVPGSVPAASRVVQHKLQAFNPVYFTGGPRYYSYSSKYAKAARAVHTGSGAMPLFLAAPLDPPPAEETTVDVDGFIRFFANPAEQFMKRRLQVYFDSGEETVEDNELFALETLDAYKLKQDLLDTLLETGAVRGEYDRVAASGALPHGAAGRAVFDSLCGQVETFASAVRKEMLGPQLADAPIDITLAGLRVTGTIRSVFGERLVYYRMAGMKAKDYLAAWINHLLLQAAGRPGYPTATVCCAATKSKLTIVKFTAEPDPVAILTDLASLSLEGMRKPLPFFPEASRLFVEKIRKGEGEAEALRSAREEWSKKSFSGAPAESDDRYVARCFGDPESFPEEFTDIARRVFTPLLNNCDRAEGRDA
jgi:exodeoxyribonuclease V gamma subunit